MLRAVAFQFIAAGLLSAAAGLTSQTQARVLVVNGPGAQFTAIQPAIDAAVDGDVVLVRSGDYRAPGGSQTENILMVDNKSISLVVDAGAGVYTDAIVVSNLAAGKTLVISGAGGNFLASSTPRVAETGTHVPGLSVQSCMGSVRVEGISISGFHGAEITASGDVAFTNCSITGNSGYGTCCVPTGDLPTAVTVRGSSLAFYESQVAGGGGEPGTGAGGPGGHGIDVDGILFASGTTFTGGSGGTSTFPGASGEGGPGGDGILLVAGTAALLDCVATAGPGGSATGAGAPGPPGQPIVAPPGTVTQLAGSARSLEAQAPAATRASLALTFRGEPGDQVVLLLSRAPGFRYSLVDKGVYLVAEPPEQQIPMGTIPGSGVLTATLSLPQLAPGVTNEDLFVQGRMTNGPSQSVLSNAATLVRWASDAVTGVGPALTSAAFAVDISPNPSAGIVAIRLLGVPPNGDAMVQIVDLAGRVLRHWNVKVGADGGGVLLWDGKQPDQTRMPSGIYFVRGSAGGRVALKRMTITR